MCQLSSTKEGIQAFWGTLCITQIFLEIDLIGQYWSRYSKRRECKMMYYYYIKYQAESLWGGYQITNIKVVWAGVEKINYALKSNNCIFSVNNKKKSNHILTDKHTSVNCSLYLGCLEEEGGGVTCRVGWEYIRSR